MKFTRFEIKNFKGIKGAELRLDQRPGGSIYTLVGLNESGKTTVLEAINAFSRESEGVESLFTEYRPSATLQSFIPKHKKSNFNGDISITAHLELSKDDVEEIRCFCVNNLQMSIDIHALGNHFFIIRGHKFEDSEYKSSSNLWSMSLHGKKKGQRKFHSLLATDPEWQKIIAFVAKMLPSIYYFPTFLFSFPQKIYLTPHEDEKPINSYYRQIIQDVLDSIGEDLEVQRHIVDRVAKAKERATPSVTNPFSWFGSDAKEQIDSVLLKIGNKVTDVIFTSWNQIFHGQIQQKTVGVEFGVETPDGRAGDLVYLKFFIKDGASKFAISERSLGFRWFFAFCCLRSSALQGGEVDLRCSCWMSRRPIFTPGRKLNYWQASRKSLPLEISSYILLTVII